MTWYDVGYNDGDLYVQYFWERNYKNSNVYLWVYIEYHEDSETSKTPEDLYNSRLGEVKEAVEKGYIDGGKYGKVKIKKEKNKETEYVLKEYYPDPEKDRSYKKPQLKKTTI